MVAGAKLVAVPEYARSVLPNVSLAPQIHCKCKDCKNPYNNGGYCDKCASPVEEAKTAMHDAESDSDSEEELELQFIGNEIDMSSCFDEYMYSIIIIMYFVLCVLDNLTTVTMEIL